jgi:hypothetical protein
MILNLKMHFIKIELGGIIKVLVMQATSESPIVRDLAIQWLNQVSILKIFWIYSPIISTD